MVKKRWSTPTVRGLPSRTEGAGKTLLHPNRHLLDQILIFLVYYSPASNMLNSAALALLITCGR